MKMHKLTITPEVYKKIPCEERALFVCAGHFSNELNALRKLILISNSTQCQHKVAQYGVTVQNLMLLKVMGTKSYEAYKIIAKEADKNYFKERIVKARPQVILSVSKLKKIFEVPYTSLAWVRDKLGAHYDVGLINKTVKKELSEEQYLYISEQSGNCLYHMCEEVLIPAMFKGEATSENFNAIINEIHEVAEIVQECAQEIMIYIGVTYGGEGWFDEGRHEEIPFVDADNLSLPFFVNFAEM